MQETVPSVPRYTPPSAIAVFVAFGVLLATLVTSVVDAASTFLTGLGSNYWTLWTARLTTNMISNLVIVPTIVILGVKGLSWFRRVNPARYFEAGVLAVGIVTVSLLVFSAEKGAGGKPAFIFAPFPLLPWAALRFEAGGVRGAQVGVLMVVVRESAPRV